MINILKNFKKLNEREFYDATRKNIYAVYDAKTVRVYQAYSYKIADEIKRLGRFGENFKLERMTWIKPSFLWMMNRCG